MLTTMILVEKAHAGGGYDDEMTIGDCAALGIVILIALALVALFGKG